VDAAAAAGLITQLGYPTTPAEMAQRLAAVSAHPDYCTWVAVVGGQVVGLAGTRLGRSYAHNGPYGQLLALVVGEGWRDRGIGALLVGQVERWFREQGAETVMVTSRHTWQAAHRFYKRLGYEDTGVRLVKHRGDTNDTDEHR
jgi:GNAT superfamily N-acetyltransferase